MISLDEVTKDWERDGVWKIAPAGLAWIKDGAHIAIGERATDKERFNRFFHAMLEAGHYFAPSAFEAGFVSVAHGEAEIDATVAVARAVFAQLG